MPQRRKETQGERIVDSLKVTAPIAGPDRRKAAIARASVRHPEGRGLLGRAAECEPAGLPDATGDASQFAEHVHRRRRGGKRERRGERKRYRPHAAAFRIRCRRRASGLMALVLV